jgi:hypothetical protein
MILGLSTVAFPLSIALRATSKLHPDMNFRGAPMNQRPKAQNLRQVPHTTEVEARQIEPEDPERWDGLA